MSLKKYLILIAFFVGILSYLSANEEHASENMSESEKNITFYAGINPIALLSFLPGAAGAYGTGFGAASNQEFGIALYGGIHFANAHSLEMRFSTGPADAVVWDTQIQFGYIWYPLEHFLNWNGGLNTGIILRQFFWNNRITDYVTFNLTPELLLGWRFKVKSIAIDLRGGWNFASVTWSNMPRTKAAAGWTPFPYNLTLTTGIIWILK